MTKPTVTREQVMAAYRPFVLAGYTSPDDLPAAGREIERANALFGEWQMAAMEAAEVSEAADARLQYELELSLLYVDAGFTDPEYLDEVANDWLLQSLEEAEEKNWTQIAEHIRALRAKILAELA